MTLAADRTTWQTLAAGVLYFALVFGAGFILGPIRVLVVAPHVGERVAELIEAPIMLAVIVFVARWLCRRFPRLNAAAWAVAGLTALALVLGAEFAVMKLFWRMTLTQYLGARDPVGLVAYGALLVLFAAMPSIAYRRRTPRQ